jgi:hypothetical protein
MMRGEVLMAKKNKSVTQRSAAAKKRSAGTGRSSAEVKAVIADLVAGNHILYRQGVLDGFGHLSARHPHNPQRFLMSRARAPGMVVAADIMEFGPDGAPIKDTGRPVYSERFIHSEIYRARPDVHSVLHCGRSGWGSCIQQCRCSTPAMPRASPIS